MDSLAYIVSMRLLIFAIYILLGLNSVSFAGEIGPVWGLKEGYILDVQEERWERTYELSLVRKPKQGKPLHQKIFDPALKREFKQRYEQRFGFTDIDRNINTPNRYAEQEYTAGVWVTPEEDQRLRQQFGEYMVKRLGEHHVDAYFKSNPSVRPVYELKERISKVKVKVRKGYNLRINYSYSGNYLNLRMENPFEIYTRVTLEMDPDNFGPSDIQETRLYLSYPVKKDLSVATDYRVEAEYLSLIGKKAVSRNLATTITGSTRNLTEAEIAKHNGIEHDQRLILGLSWDH